MGEKTVGLNETYTYNLKVPIGSISVPLVTTRVYEEVLYLTVGVGSVAFADITCSTVVLQCYRRQATPMEQAKIRPSATLYSLDRSLLLICLETNADHTQT